MNYCTKCGNELYEGDSYCKNCGSKKIETQPVSLTNNARAPQPESLNRKGEPVKKKSNIVLYCIVAVLAIAVGVGTFFLFFSSNNNGDNKGPDRILTIQDIEKKAADGTINAIQDESGSYIFISGTFTDAIVNSASDAADVLNNASALFGDGFSADETDFTLQSISGGIAGASNFYKYSSTVNNVPVLGSQIILSTNDDGTVKSLSSTYDNRINYIDTTPTITSDDAVDVAKQDVIENVFETLEAMVYSADIDIVELEQLFITSLTVNTELLIHATRTTSDPVLVWAVSIETDSGEHIINDDDFEEEEYNDEGNAFLPYVSMRYYINANGATQGHIFIAESNIVQSWQPDEVEAEDLWGNKILVNVETRRNRYRLRDATWGISTYSANYLPSSPVPGSVTVVLLPGSRISNNQRTAPCSNAASAHAYTSIARRFYKNTDGINRNSMDGEGGEVKISMDYKGVKKFNEWYSFEKRQVGYKGVGGERALDVVGHEFTHGVVHYVTGRENSTTQRFLGIADFAKSEAGALFEAYADIMGSFIEGKTCKERWSFGEDIANRNLPYRDMSIPICYVFDAAGKPTPKTHADFNGDNGPHANSLIFSHAAYLMMDDERTRTIETNIELWAVVFYRSLFEMPENMSFRGAAGAVMSAAKNHGFTKEQLEAIECAFFKVGIFDSRKNYFDRYMPHATGDCACFREESAPISTPEPLPAPIQTPEPLPAPIQTPEPPTTPTPEPTPESSPTRTHRNLQRLYDAVNDPDVTVSLDIDFDDGSYIILMTYSRDGEFSLVSGYGTARDESIRFVRPVFTLFSDRIELHIPGVTTELLTLTGNMRGTYGSDPIWWHFNDNIGNH